MRPFLAAALTAIFTTSSGATELPNIIYILADDLGYGDVQCLNPKRGKILTPHMDKVAAEGMTLIRHHPSAHQPATAF